MDQLVVHTLSVFMSLFAIMNPIANTPIFLALTADDSSAVRKKVAMQSVLTAFVIVTAFTLLGNLIFSLFGITLPAFRIMGGILVALIGYQMLHGEQSAVHQPSDEDREDSQAAALGVAVTPLAIPILAGPGTIATAMSYSSGGGAAEIAITLACFTVLCAITYVCFVYGEVFVRFLGRSGLGVITRIMGLVLAVIGVQMLITGVAGAVRSYQ